ncbi:MAG: ABC transporter ATP-binding protein [Burkholderiales bacterium]|nr:ABC transporter ATP-binding protein [Phycisphaerae bacterium]
MNSELLSSEPPDLEKPRRRRHGEFWRACGFLAPYRTYVIISIVSALLSGLVLTSGVGVMYPIAETLTSDTPKTVQQLVQDRIDSSRAKGNSTLYLEWLQPIARIVPTRPVLTIGFMFVVLFIMAVVGNVFRFFQEFLSDRSAISAINDIRRRLYDHILHLPLGYFGKHGTSDVTSRLVQDAQSLQDGFKTVLGQAIAEPIKAGLALIVAAIIDWRLTLFIIVFAPLMMAMIKKFGKKVRRASRAALQNSSQMLGQIEGTLSGIRVVKSATAERFERRRYATIMKSLQHDQVQMAKYEAYSTPTLEILGMLAVGCVLIVASYMIFEQKTLSRSGFLLLLLCLVSIGESLRRLSKLNNVLQRSNSAAARIFELLDSPIERSPSEAGTKRVLRTLKQSVVFEDVTFQYPGTNHTAVEHVSLTVARGQSIAIVGRNGSGKTTLLSLLPRFFEPSGGRILIDGITVNDLTLPSLRRSIAIVTQDPIIFPGTIAENIAYGQPNITREQIESAARQAFAHDFILQKPAGYDARLDGLGGQLSGGQKQRINIARAILRNSPILILDEATSQVDAESEHLIQQAIERLMHQRTTFVIAHRFSTILAADTIVVMEQGRIVGEGKHEQLLANCMTYKQLYERQLVGAA